MTARKVYCTSGVESEADYCRRHRLFPGTVLVGDEGHGPTVIRITALGERTLLAATVSHNGSPVGNHEGQWTLSCRNWQRVPRREQVTA